MLLLDNDDVNGCIANQKWQNGVLLTHGVLLSRILKHMKITYTTPYAGALRKIRRATQVYMKQQQKKSWKSVKGFSKWYRYTPACMEISTHWALLSGTEFTASWIELNMVPPCLPTVMYPAWPGSCWFLVERGWPFLWWWPWPGAAHRPLLSTLCAAGTYSTGWVEAKADFRLLKSLAWQRSRFP